jgi:hypothetical protein
VTSGTISVDKVKYLELFKSAFRYRLLTVFRIVCTLKFKTLEELSPSEINGFRVFFILLIKLFDHCRIGVAEIG